MKRIERTALAALHVVVVTVTVHVWHVVTSDRFMDAYVDVGMEHGSVIIERVLAGQER